MLRDSRQGRAVLISTGVTGHGMPGARAYVAAKAGLDGLVAVLNGRGGCRHLLQPRRPGFTLTKANLARFPDEVGESVRTRTPLWPLGPYAPAHPPDRRPVPDGVPPTPPVVSTPCVLRLVWRSSVRIGEAQRTLCP
jgi:NAD(P)-dependent dehydrogenase (short-subunit alcohol dehydrogenase family)